MAGKTTTNILIGKNIEVKKCLKSPFATYKIFCWKNIPKINLNAAKNGGCDFLQQRLADLDVVWLLDVRRF
jgi:hypothetical protein